MAGVEMDEDGDENVIDDNVVNNVADEDAVDADADADADNEGEGEDEDEDVDVQVGLVDIVDGIVVEDRRGITVLTVTRLGILDEGAGGRLALGALGSTR